MATTRSMSSLSQPSWLPNQPLAGEPTGIGNGEIAADGSLARDGSVTMRGSRPPRCWSGRRTAAPAASSWCLAFRTSYLSLLGVCRSDGSTIVHSCTRT